jgi:hypothetical protein
MVQTIPSRHCPDYLVFCLSPRSLVTSLTFVDATSCRLNVGSYFEPRIVGLSEGQAVTAQKGFGVANLGNNRAACYGYSHIESYTGLQVLLRLFECCRSAWAVARSEAEWSLALKPDSRSSASLSCRPRMPPRV